MLSIEEHIRNLCQWPHRGTTSGYERLAGDYAGDHLNSLGYKVEEESFIAPDSALYRSFIFIIICEIAAMAISFTGSGASIVIGAFPFFYLFAKFYLMWPIDNYFFPTGKSRNIVARLANPDATKKVILTAHLDTQLGSYLFGPRWVGMHGFFTATTAIGSLVTLVLCIIRVAGARGRWYATAQIVVVIIALLPMLYFFLKAEYTGQYVNGASDDATGMGVILRLADELKEDPPKDVEVWVLATGAEESGLCGMMHFLKRGLGKDLGKNNTYFINHDNLGSGSLKYLTAEVFPTIKYDSGLVKLAEEVAADSDYPNATAGFWGVPTDALAPTIMGLPAMTIFAYDDQGRTPHYHHVSDTVENVDFAVSEAAKRFTRGIIARLDGRSGERNGP